MNGSSQEKKRGGFTLVEIMIVVAIIALIVSIAIPSFLRARRFAQNTDFMNSLRVFAGAVEQFAAETSAYPIDSSTGQFPPGFETLISRDDWDRRPSIGGLWDIEYDEMGVVSAVGVHQYTASESQLIEIDERFDDGSLSTGTLRKIANDRYYYVVHD